MHKCERAQGKRNTAGWSIYSVMELVCICSVSRMTKIRFRNIFAVNSAQTTNDFSPHPAQTALRWSLVGVPIFSFCQLPRIHKLATEHIQNHPFDHKSNVFSLKRKILKSCLCIQYISAAHHDHVRMKQKQCFMISAAYLTGLKCLMYPKRTTKTPTYNENESLPATLSRCIAADLNGGIQRQQTWKKELSEVKL